MTTYWNPTTGRWESREELGERPATAETVIASEGAFWVDLPPRILMARLRAKADWLQEFGNPFEDLDEGYPADPVDCWPPHPPGG